MTGYARFGLAALALSAVSAPGCCGHIERSDSSRSLAYLGRTLSGQAAADAAATRDTISGAPAALARQFDTAGSDLSRACELYYGR